MGREQHGGAVGDGFADQVRQEGAGGGIEPGVRLIEQPQGRAAGHQRGQGHPATLAGREPSGGRVAEAPDQAQALERLVAGGGGQAEGLHGEADVLRRGELVVERGGMAQQADVAPHGGVVRR